MGRDGGPLAGLRVLEVAGLGSVRIAGMMLADLGADVVRIDRPGDPNRGTPSDPVLRGRSLVETDLKSPEGLATALDLAAEADVLLESMRPGVAERLGIGPADCLARNPRLVYARITGWGQDGPLASFAGHDINYTALTGVLRALGRDGERPPPPLNLLGFGGGAAVGLVGILAALRVAEHTGQGQVVDAAVVDGISVLAQMVWSAVGRGEWNHQRESNVNDGGTPFYDTYACADGEFMAVGALEPKFYARLVEGLGLAGEDLPEQYDTAGWPELRARFTAAFASRTSAEWASVFAGLDACVTPVLGFDTAADHPHMASRATIVRPGGVPQAAPAPRFSQTPAPPPEPARDAEPIADVLTRWRAR